MISLLLLAWAGAVAGLVPGPLSGARWVYRAPRLGVAVWQAVTFSVLFALLLAGLAGLLHSDGSHAVLCASWQICLDALRGAHGPTGQVIAGLGLLLVVVLAARIGMAVWQVWCGATRERRRHAQIVSMIGRPTDDGSMTIIPAEQPLAYLVPGRHARVVVSAGAVAMLTPDELDAVLAHERAHATGRHHRLLDVVRVVHSALPRLALFAHAHRQIGRLVELRADEVAARTHSPLALARALVTMAAPEPNQPSRPAPVPIALAADGGDPVERITRLLQPPAPLPPAALAAGLMVVALVCAVPLVLAVLVRLLPVVIGGVWTL